MSEQRKELVDGQLSVADERAQGADRQFIVLGNREIRARSGLDEHQVGSDLADPAPAGALERTRGPWRPEMLASRAMA